MAPKGTITAACIGPHVTDYIFKSPYPLGPDTKVLVFKELSKDFRAGMATRYARAFNALGNAMIKTHAELISVAGRDAIGKEGERLLRKEGIGTKHLSLHGSFTGTSLLGVSPPNNRLAMMSLPPELRHQGEPKHYEIKDDEIKRIVDKANVLLLSGSGNVRLQTRLARRAIEANKIVILELEIRPDSGETEDADNYELLKLSSAVKVAEQYLDSRQTATPGNIEQAIRDIVERNDLEHAVLTLGSMGSMYVGRNGKATQVGIYETENIKDTTGAGEAFMAGLAYGLCCGRNAIESIRFASAYSSFIIEKLGFPEPGDFPTEIEIDERAKKIGENEW